MNQCANVDQYPLPNEEELFATLSGCQVFSKVYLSHAYQQVELEDDSRMYVTINTHKGLFHCKRLALGVSIVPDIFQHIVDRLLQEVKFTICRLDDILI